MNKNHKQAQRVDIISEQLCIKVKSLTSYDIGYHLSSYIPHMYIIWPFGFNYKPAIDISFHFIVGIRVLN